MEDKKIQIQSLLIQADNMLHSIWDTSVSDGELDETDNVEVARKHLKNCYERVLRIYDNK